MSISGPALELLPGIAFFVVLCAVRLRTPKPRYRPPVRS